MNSFQILDNQGNAIDINQLDKEVCELMGVEQHKKWYCTLGKREDHPSRWEFLLRTSNWYDTIGWMIAEGKSFEDILAYYADVMKDFIGKEDETGNILTLETIYPYHTLVLNTWISKGYKAKQIIE